MGKSLGHPSFSAPVKWGWHFPTQPTLWDKGPYYPAWTLTCLTSLAAKMILPHETALHRFERNSYPLCIFSSQYSREVAWDYNFPGILGNAIREGKYGADSVSSAFGIYQVWLEFFQCKCYSLKCGLHKDTNKWVELTCFLWKTLGSLLRTVPYFPQCPQRQM